MATDFKTVRWDAKGNPYWVVNDKPYYIPPETASQMDDPKVQQWAQKNQVQDNGALKTRPQWNPQTGNWDSSVDWSNLANIGIGGAIAAPLISAALPAAGASSAAAPATASSYAAPAAAASTAAPAAAATAAPALGGGATVGANLGAASALPAAATGGGVTAGGIFKSLLPKDNAGWAALGANVLGNVIQSRQVDKATQAQVDAANKALELQSNVYQQQRSDLAPYRASGNGALSLLNLGMGISPQDTPTLPAFQQPAQTPQRGATDQAGQTAIPRSLSTLGQPQAGGTVNMIAPNGMRASIPQDQVQHYTQMGARVA